MLAAISIYVFTTIFVMISWTILLVSISLCQWLLKWLDDDDTQVYNIYFNGFMLRNGYHRNKPYSRGSDRQWMYVRNVKLSAWGDDDDDNYSDGGVAYLDSVGCIAISGICSYLLTQFTIPCIIVIVTFAAFRGLRFVIRINKKVIKLEKIK